MLLIGHIQAQTWPLIASTAQLHFQHSDSSFITHTLKVDSVYNLPNGETAYFLNRVVTPCDTCSTPARLRNQGQFLGKTLQIDSYGTVRSAWRDTFLFNPNWTDTTWYFGSRYHLSATIGMASPQTALGTPDSVKTIALSNGAVIWLSQKYGLLSFPDFDHGGRYDLAGFQTPTALTGEKPPGFYEFFDFKNGDVFQWETLEAWPGEGNYNSGTEKWTILDRQDYGDTIRYQIIRGIFFVYGNNGPHLISRSLDTLWMNLHPSAFPVFAAYYPGQMVSFDTMNIINYNYAAVQNGSDFKQIGSAWKGDWQSNLNCDMLTVTGDPANDEVLLCEPCWVFGQRFETGKGFTQDHTQCFEFDSYKIMNAWAKNGDTTKIAGNYYGLYPDTYFKTVDVREPVSNVRIDIIPNPVLDLATVLVTGISATDLTFEVRNIVGQLIVSRQGLPGSLRLDLHNLTPGVYNLTVSNAQILTSKQFIKIR
jgi:hypothetical protein